MASSTRTTTGADPDGTGPNGAGNDSADPSGAGPDGTRPAGRLDPPPDAEPRDGTAPDAGAARPWTRRLLGWPAQAAASTLLLALLSHMRYLYNAGDRDHTVLSPLGMRWADPDAFKGDWTLDNAPQPHWVFDIVTYVGASTGTLGLVYLIYWLATMAAFGVATTLLARTWVPRVSWFAVVAVTVVTAIGPLYVLGSGVQFYATALPNALGGNLLYLCAAALLVGRHRLAAAAGVATALAHVQHGVVALVLMLLLAGAFAVFRRRIEWWLVGASAVTVGIVVFNLRLRPVAGDLKDFQEVCGVLIPYHCEATSWLFNIFWGGLAFISMALLTFAFIGRRELLRWVVVVVLPVLGLTAGVLADRLDVPTLGLAAQGLNVYRLSIELFPFAVWGLLAAAFAPLSVRWRWITMAATMFLGSYALRSGYWALPGEFNWWRERNEVTSVPWLFVAGLFLLAAVVVQTVPGLVPERRWTKPEWLAQASVGAGILVLVLAGVAGHQFALRKFDPRFFPYPGLTAWGEEVRKVVPPGEQLLMPPSNTRVRIATQRGVVIDCKLAPYGGAAWHEYRSRMEAIGGFIECGAGGWRSVDAVKLADLARRYGADYIVTRSDEQTDVKIAADLTAQGWVQVAAERPGAPFRVFKAPWETQ